MPHCAKKYLSYIVSTKLFPKKKDAESYAALIALKKLYERKFLDEHLSNTKALP
jgi:hypothetical protein